MTVKRIVVGIDESAGARLALQWAVHEARLHGADVTAVMAWDLLDQHHPVADSFNPKYGQDEAEAALRDFVDGALGAGESVQQVATCDLPARALLEAAASADLLVVGARGTGGFEGLLVGSVARRCLHHATVPTAVVRRTARRASSTTESIVTGVDGSTAARAALAWAGREAKVRSASLVAIHAWTVFAGEPFGSSLVSAESLELASGALLDTELQAAGVAAEARSVAGSPGGVLIGASKDADLVVVGHRGQRGFVGRLRVLGSVANQVADHAACTVVVVPD